MIRQNSGSMAEGINNLCNSRLASSLVDTLKENDVKRICLSKIGFIKTFANKIYEYNYTFKNIEYRIFYYEY